MFVAVRFDDSGPTGALRRMGDRLRGRNLQAQQRSFHGSDYWEICQRTYGAEPRWEELAECCGPLGAKLLLPRGIGPPAGSHLRVLPLDFFFARLTAECALQLLEAMGPQGKTACVGIVDMEGCWGRLADTLTPACGALRAYSSRPERYLMRAEALLRDCGASMTVCDSPDDLSDCAFCIAPAPAGVLRIPAPVLTVGRSLIQGAPTVGDFGLALPEELLSQVPEGIAPEDFFGALLLYGTWRPGSFPPICALRIDGRLADLQQLREMVSSKCR